MNTKSHILISASAAVALGLALAFSCPAVTQAQQALPFRTSSAPAPYLLGTDDVLSIQVSNFAELSVPQVTVPSDGRITVPVLGSLAVAGKTTAQVTQILTSRWGQYVVSPLVTVTLTTRRHQNLQVYGFVTHAQTVEYQPAMRLSEALATVGGAAENGDLTHVIVTHKNGRVQTADLSNPLTAGGTAQDIMLAPDDVIYVPERHLQVSVLGEVVKPGSYEYTDKMTVLDALKDADNVNLSTANLSQATLRHNGTESTLNLHDLLTLGKTADNVALSPGDSIFIPELHNRVYVDGAVGHPGYYALRPGDRLVDAINGCGGTIAGVSDLKLVDVIHQDRVHNVNTAQTVDFGQFLQKGNAAANVPLSPDDAIYIPVKGHHPGLGEVISTLAGVGAVATGARAF
ncbi:MAG: SLBB domain-containing protein [Janthinobacterium lividum]